MRPASSARRSAATTAASNCVPAPPSSSARAAASPRAGAVAAVGGHRLVGVGHGEDARLERDLVPAQAARVAEAVGALVVSEDPLAQVGELGARQEARADLGVRVHLLPLALVERAGLREHAVRDADLADVVQHAGEPHALHALLLEAELARHQLRVAARRCASAGPCRCRGCRAPRPARSPWRAAAPCPPGCPRRAHGPPRRCRSRCGRRRGPSRRPRPGRPRAAGRRRRCRAPGAVATPKLNFTPTVASAKLRWVGAAQTLGDDERAALVRLREQQRELLAADPGRDVDAPLPLERVARDGLERRVARRVAVLLVHLAEASRCRRRSRTSGGRRGVARSSSSSSSSSKARRLSSPVRGSVRFGVGDARAQRPQAPALAQRRRPPARGRRRRARSGARMPAGSISRCYRPEIRSPLKR